MTSNYNYVCMRLCIKGILMYIIGAHIEDALAQPEVPVYLVTCAFLSLVMLVATQDIAVDGMWPHSCCCTAL